jgi:hypothetical protein
MFNFTLGRLLRPGGVTKLSLKMFENQQGNWAHAGNATEPIAKAVAMG